MKHRRENYWDSRCFGANLPRSRSEIATVSELIERIDDDLREILATHRPESLPATVQVEIREILAKFENA